LIGRVAVVTGASKGIGRSIAVRMACEGAKVVINYRSDSQGADEAVTECEAVGGEGCAVKIHADIATVAECQRLMAESCEKFGKVDVLVNNAGMEVQQSFWEVTEENYDKVMNTNLKGAFFMTQAFVQKLQAAKMKGSVINISSVHEDLPFPGFCPYCISKGGLKMMTRNLSIELAPLGITVNNIAPGAIETPMNMSVLKEPTKMAQLLQNIPLARLGKPEDISSCAVYLASEEASYVTGSTVCIDGGLTWNYIENH